MPLKVARTARMIAWTALFCVLAVEIVARVALSSPAVAARVFGRGREGRLLDALARYTQRRGTAGVPPYDGVITFDPRWGWTNRPGAVAQSGGLVTVSSQGLRSSREYAENKPAGMTRLEVFGDSFAFGTDAGDADPFAAQIEQRDASLEAMNFAVGGYGFDQALLRYQEDGQRFHPDVVVVLALASETHRCDLDFTTWFKPYFEAQGNSLALLGRPVPSPEEVYAAYLRRPRVLDVLDLLGAAETARGRSPPPDLWERVLRQFVDTIAASGAHPLLVTAPIYPGDPSNPVSMSLRNVCTGRAVECVDLRGEFDAASAAGVTLRQGVHWSRAAHRIVADAIFRAVASHPQ